jgi:hypothetical protein
MTSHRRGVVVGGGVPSSSRSRRRRRRDDTTDEIVDGATGDCRRSKLAKAIPREDAHHHQLSHLLFILGIPGAIKLYERFTVICLDSYTLIKCNVIIHRNLLCIP